MRSGTILFFALALVGYKSWGQSSNLEVKQLSISKWNAFDGIPYAQSPEANLGATSFEVLENENRIAFLSNATNEIIVTDKNSGKAIKKFPVVSAPRDFIYDNSSFYVLSERQVILYDTNGKEKNNFTFPNAYLGTERLLRFNNATYLLLPNGNSLKIESDGFSLISQEYEGWITSAGYFVKTEIDGNNSYGVKVIHSNGKSFNKVFTTDKKVAGVYVVGSSNNRVVLDVQTFISENPIAIERNIVSIKLTNDGLESAIASIKVPDSYYVLSNKEFYVSENGTILNMVTSEQGAHIFSLTETNSNISKEYPQSLMSKKYHFNDHLQKIKEK
ncbi:MAG: hypothetical protein H0W84_05990 [Bacteroidetes bacterium]|nr:hypothetical protein [Bacteroidota bacterium]